MIRFSHEANSWQTDYNVAVSDCREVWKNISANRARMLFDRYNYLVLIH